MIRRPNHQDWINLSEKTNIPFRVQAIRKLPPHITSLRLAWEKLGSKKIISLIQALPTHVTELELHGYDLDRKSRDELTRIIKALPAHVTSLTVTAINLIRGHKLKSIILALPPHLASLNLSNNDLGNSSSAEHISVDELISSMQALPPNLSSLNLSDDRGFRGTTVDELISIMQALPPYLTSLDLKLGLDNMTGDEIKRILQALPPNLASLNLSLYGLRNKTEDELKSIMEALPPYTSLDLSYYFSSYETEEIKRILQALPPNLASLKLSHNELGNKTVDELISIIQALRPKNLLSLDLSNNSLRYKTANEIKRIMQELPPNLASLNLSDTDLDYKTVDELISILEKLPTNLKSLDLSGIFFSDLNITKAEFKQILAALPGSLTTLNVPRHSSILSKASSLLREGYNLNQARAKILNPNEVIGLSADDTDLPIDLNAITLSYLSPIPEKDATQLLKKEGAHQKACQKKLEEINSECQKYLELLLAGKEVGSLDSKTKKQYDEITKVLEIISNDSRSSIEKKEELAARFQNTQFCEALSTPKKSRLSSFFSKETPDKGAEFIKNIQDLLEIKLEAQQMRPR